MADQSGSDNEKIGGGETGLKMCGKLLGGRLDGLRSLTGIGLGLAREYR